MKKVITYGSFDLFHEGHYNLLKRAKALGDYLIVGVTTEQYDESRGKLNIVDSLDKRIENVRQTGFADEIIVKTIRDRRWRMCRSMESIFLRLAQIGQGLLII